MTKVPIQNQGFRLDLNLQESNDDDAAWDNLYNPGISKDLAILVNNLRNTSILGPGNTSPVSISLTTNEINDANYEVNNVNTKAPHFFTFTKSSGELTDSTFTNDDTIQVNEEITFNIGDRSGDVATGQEEFISPGTHSWTAPAGVTQVSVVAIGGGGNGQSLNATERCGGGGGLGYKNNISVTPGQSYTVVVGDTGAAAQGNTGAGGPGGDSYFIDTSTVKGGGGEGGGIPSLPGSDPGGDGGGYTGDGGGNGGNGGTGGYTANARGGGGGGGAGGYTGDGGDGASFPGGVGATGNGGGGGGGGCLATIPESPGGGDGGGTGIKGEGDNGAGGIQDRAPGNSFGSAGSSHDQNASTSGDPTASPPYSRWSDNLYGGGGGGANGDAPGGSGAVRIIWGANRSFPSTNTADQTTTVHEGNGSGTVGSLATETLVPNKDYYVCSSNARNAFKISTTPSGDSVGVSTIPIISVNSNNGSFTSTFGFIRKDGVTAPNLTAFIKPEVLDEDFNYLGSTGINGSFSNNVTAYEYSEFLIEKKYKTNKDILSDRDVKFEGSVRVKDPQGYNDGATALNATNPDGTPNSPGIFIGNTRAFSTDNNPWEKDVSLFSTKSHSDEFTIGDLEFGGEIDASGVVTGGQIKIKGLSAEIVDITASDSKLVNKLSGSNPNVYKFPMIINGETYYILVERE